MGEIFEQAPEAINELVSEFYSMPVVGELASVLCVSQYTFWLFISCIVLVVLMLVYVKKMQLVPHGVFQNGVEYVIDYISNDVLKNILGESWKKHFPFLMTIFFFVLVNNIVGIIPGMKPGTGTISVTAVIAIAVFVYFIAMGVHAKGVGGYIKSFAPAGVMFPLNLLVGAIEVISTILRPITLAIRLFCNMFAGHVVLGSFAILVSLFAEPLIEQVSLANAVGLLPSAVFFVILLIIYAIEMFVAYIQAYVFTMLSAVYISGAEEEE